MPTDAWSADAIAMMTFAVITVTHGKLGSNTVTSKFLESRLWLSRSVDYTVSPRRALAYHPEADTPH
jgi:hypothetical protein